MATINLVTALKLLRYNTDAEIATILQSTIDELDRLYKVEEQLHYVSKQQDALKKEPRVGDIAICQGCGLEIIYVGPYWNHGPGVLQPRHPAWPKEVDPTAA